MTKLIIYGAVVPPQKVQMRIDLRQALKITLDRVKAKLGRTDHLDYRNLVDGTSFNRGDLSIALGANAAVQRTSPGTNISYAQWESIHSTPINAGVLFAGGGYFFLNDKGQLPARVKKDCESLLASGVKYAFLGVGVNQVNGNEGEILQGEIAASDISLVSTLLNGAAFVSVRDQQTFDKLQHLTDSSIFLYGDPALFLSHPERTKSIWPTTKRIRIGINIPFHGPAANERVKRDFHLYIDFFRRLHRATGADFYFMVHFDSEVLMAYLLRDAGLPVTIVDGDVATLQATYAGLDMHVGGMLHSCILACSVGTPCVGIAYDVKHAGFFSVMGIPELSIPATPFDVDAMVLTCIQAFKDRLAIRDHLNTRREMLRAEGDRFLQTQLPKLM